MFIGLCGGICAGKHEVANYLIEQHAFSLLHLARTFDAPLAGQSDAVASLQGDSRLKYDETAKDTYFLTVDSLLEFVTKRWQQRWVIVDVWDENILETLIRRPFFLLVSIGAPVSLRWRRFTERCKSHTHFPPTLEDFVLQDDNHLYNHKSGLANVIHHAEVHLINATSSLQKLHDALEELDLLNSQRMRPSWDLYFMQLASLAAQRSNCMKRRVGCVLVREKRVISTGYNGTPRNLKNCNDGGCARCNGGQGAGLGLSTCLCIHAEENALLEAGRERIREGSILYCDTCPCLTCSIKITQVGISEVVYAQGYSMDYETAAVFREGGVKLRQFSPPRKGLVHLDRDNSERLQGLINVFPQESYLKSSVFPKKFLLDIAWTTMPTAHLLDYVAGNVRSLVNAIEKVGYTVEWIKEPNDIEAAERLILPGVGHFGHCLTQFNKGGYLEPIRKHIQSGKPFMGICVGLQALFEGSAENPLVPGLGLIPGRLTRFDDTDKSVPQIGWNSAITSQTGQAQEVSHYGLRASSKYYYVHSYAMPYRRCLLEDAGWTVATATYGSETFVGAIGKDNVFATQFHPEKSGVAGLRVLKAFLTGKRWETITDLGRSHEIRTGLTRRIIACLDVRTNDHGDLVVTKGDQYDVREKDNAANGGQVRNLGKPVDMARKYYEQGSDEITFLNITSFRNCPLADLPMLEILRLTSETVFVPLTIGGGIRDTIDTDGTRVSALDIATMYFKSGADKVSIGSDAVTAAEEYITRGKVLSGTTAIETISAAYGNQAVVVSVDPRRIYVQEPEQTRHHTIRTRFYGPSAEKYCWYQCTIKGGREGRDIDVRQLVTAVEAMGAGEILLNCIDKDGSNSGFDLELINDVKEAITIPVIASSGAGNPFHFQEVFQSTTTDAALGAGMFHRGEYTVKQVKDYLASQGLLVRHYEDKI